MFFRNVFVLDERKSVPVQPHKMPHIPVQVTRQHSACFGNQLMDGKLRSDGIEIGMFVCEDKIHCGTDCIGSTHTRQSREWRTIPSSLGGTQSSLCDRLTKNSKFSRGFNASRTS